MDSGEKSSVLWHCRRGTQEMDLLLLQFVEEHYYNLTAEEQAAFRHLLEQADPDIMDWILGKTEPPSAAIKQIVDILRTVRVSPRPIIN